MGKNIEDKIEIGRFLKYTNYPLYKIPMAEKGIENNNLNYVKNSLLFDIENDYNQEKPICDKKIEMVMIQKLISAMEYAQSPEEQFERLGLK